MTINSARARHCTAPAAARSRRNYKSCSNLDKLVVWSPPVHNAFVSAITKRWGILGSSSLRLIHLNFSKRMTCVETSRSNSKHKNAMANLEADYSLLPPSCCYRKERAKSRRAPFPRRSASSLPSGGLRPAEWVGEPGILARGTCIAVDILY